VLRELLSTAAGRAAHGFAGGRDVSTSAHNSITTSPSVQWITSASNFWLWRVKHFS